MSNDLFGYTYTKTPTGCFKCKDGKADRDGYPRATHNGATTRIYRIVYELTHGPIPKGLCIRHSCDNPACINPEHLIIGTHIDNMMDMVERKRVRGAALPGVRNYHAKLNTQQVRDIKARKHCAQHYATKYSVSRRTIYAIWEEEKWAYVA